MIRMHTRGLAEEHGIRRGLCHLELAFHIVWETSRYIWWQIILPAIQEGIPPNPVLFVKIVEIREGKELKNFLKLFYKAYSSLTTALYLGILEHPSQAVTVQQPLAHNTAAR
jgi:hypothetical protein